MTKTLTCSQGHHWQVPDAAVDQSDLSAFACPMCGANVETVSDVTSVHETHRNGSLSQGTSNDPNRLTGFEILDEAGRGGMGVVYRALDRKNNRVVALKTLQRIDAVALQRFKKEFRSLSDVAHPNLVSLYELISDGENWCFTMELIEGVDLLEYIRYGSDRSSALDTASIDVTIELSATELTAAGQPGLSLSQLDRFRNVATQLATGISALHAGGILHRDIKPSNVLVTKEGRAVVLDFGLAAALDDGDTHRHSQDSLLGTVAYMSPEQAASADVSPATDWYALGALLYEALTGRTPFEGKPLAVLQAKQTTDPPPPSTFWPGIPAELEELCVGLLQRDPTNRANGADVLRVLQQNGVTTELPAAALPETEHLIGRAHHLIALREAYSEVADGVARNVFVRGESGNGKTTLVKHFLEEIQSHQETVVLSARCYERESVPFKAIDSMIDSIVTHLKRLPASEAEAVMPRDIQALARLFPVVDQIDAVARTARRKADSFDQQELNRRAIAALREMLARMGDRCRLVVYVDDVQWGDEDSAAMVSDLLQPPDAPLMMFLGTYRSEDADTSPFLRAFRQIQLQREVPLESLLIEVKPLDHSEAVELALDLLQRDDEMARHSAEAIANESQGNPFFIAELVQHVELQGVSASKTTEQLNIVDVIWSRVQRLPEDAQRLLEVVALWGQPLQLDRAMRIANVGQSAIGPLRAGHLIRTAGSSSTIIETYHDRVRESVGAQLEQARRQQCHLRIAEEYVSHAAQNVEEALDRLTSQAVAGVAASAELSVDPAWYDIAYHFDAAGRADLAFPFALATAEKARAQFSLEVAEQQFRIAARSGQCREDAMRYRLAAGLGEVMMLRGRYGEATKKQFEEATGAASDDVARARIHGKLGVLAFKQGDDKAAAAAMESSLRLLGHRVPSHTPVFAGLLLWELFVQMLHSTFPRLFLARRGREGADVDLLAVSLYIDLSYAYFFDRLIPTFWAHLRAFNLVERYTPTRELSHVWASHGPAMALIPWLRRGEVYVRKSLDIRKEMGDVCAQGQSLHYLGVVLFTGAKFDECICACRDAVKLLEQTGDYWERNMAWWQIANALYRKGELTRAIYEAQRLYEACVEMGDDKVSRFSADVWSRASGGNVPTEIIQRELTKGQNDVWASALACLAEAVRRVRQDDLEEASKLLSQAYEMCRDSGMNAWVGPILPWAATVYRLQLESARDFVTGRRSQLLQGAGQAARRAVRISRRFKTDLPHALREAGLIAAMQGSTRRARKCLDESIAVAEQQGARFEHAQSLLARGRLGQQHRWPNAEQDCATAEQALRDMGAEFAIESDHS